MSADRKIADNVSTEKAVEMLLRKNDYVPSVMSSTSPLSPKHWAKRHPPDPEGSVSMASLMESWLVV